MFTKDDYASLSQHQVDAGKQWADDTHVGDRARQGAQKRRAKPASTVIHAAVRICPRVHVVTSMRTPSKTAFNWSGVNSVCGLTACTKACNSACTACGFQSARFGSRSTPMHSVLDRQSSCPVR